MLRHPYLLLIGFCFSTMTLHAQPLDKAREKELRYFIQRDCGSCHGPTLQGAHAPSLQPDRLRGKPDVVLQESILHGHAKGGMPTWEGMLDNQEVIWIVEQLKTGQALPGTELKRSP